MIFETNSRITESEWEVMRVVWTFDKVTSREIIDILTEKKDWKPATTKTFIGRLVKKGILDTEPKGNRYIYSAAVSEDESLKQVSNELFEHICSKEVGKTIANMISGATLSHDDIAMLEKVIEMKKKDAVDEVECNCMPGQCKCKDHHHRNDC